MNSIPRPSAPPEGAAAPLQRPIAGPWPYQAEASRSAAAPPDGPLAPAGPEPSALAAGLDAAALHAQFRATLDAGLHGLCFSPYGEGQGPGSEVTAEQVAARLAVVRPHTRWVRTFSCVDGHQHAPRQAHALGLRTLAGAWLGTNRDINRRELDGLIALARAGCVDIMAVGNEVLLREDLSEDELLEAMAYVRGAVPGVPMGTVDAYYLFERHPRVTAACDVLLANCYPFWEGCPRSLAVPYMAEMVRRVRAVAGGRPVVVSETGWPDRGSPFRGAQPSVVDALHYFIDSHAWSRAAGVELFWFAAFDEAWKVGMEGDVGAWWGLWDKDAQPKFAR